MSHIGRAKVKHHRKRKMKKEKGRKGEEEEKWKTVRRKVALRKGARRKDIQHHNWREGSE